MQLDNKLVPSSATIRIATKDRARSPGVLGVMDPAVAYNAPRLAKRRLSDASPVCLLAYTLIRLTGSIP